jgi:hypothetical protein
VVSWIGQCSHQHPHNGLRGCCHSLACFVTRGGWMLLKTLKLPCPVAIRRRLAPESGIGGSRLIQNISKIQKKSNIEKNQVGPQHKGPASHVSPSKALPCFLLLLKFGLPFHQQVAPQHTNQSRWPNKEEPRQPRANLVVACHHCKRIESIAR